MKLTNLGHVEPVVILVILEDGSSLVVSKVQDIVLGVPVRRLSQESAKLHRKIFSRLFPLISSKTYVGDPLTCSTLAFCILRSFGSFSRNLEVKFNESLRRH